MLQYFIVDTSGKIAIVGGGAAGLMAAGFAARNCSIAVLFEKNEKVGKKLYITGKGRCNLTNLVSADEALKNVVGNPRFLYGAFNAFPPEKTVEFFHSLGLKTKVERGGRVFPASDKASDVTAALLKFCESGGVDIRLNSPVASIEQSEGGWAVNGELFGAVVIASGGLSYPTTGSSGDGYSFAKALGHTVTPLFPSLVALKAAERFDLEGLTLKNVGIRAVVDGKVVFSDFGEMLFTKDGVSGPIVLSSSRFLTGKPESGREVVIDLKPALSAEKLDERILRDFNERKNADFANALSELLPKRLIGVIVGLTGIAPDKKVNAVTRAERGKLVETIKNFTLTVAGDGGFGEAVVTAGGVCVKEISPKTMMSKIRGGLFFAGEVVDVDAFTGGFNLQIAFSTGYAAGNCAAAYIQGELK